MKTHEDLAIIALMHQRFSGCCSITWRNGAGSQVDKVCEVVKNCERSAQQAADNREDDKSADGANFGP